MVIIDIERNVSVLHVMPYIINHKHLDSPRCIPPYSLRPPE